MEQQYIIPKRLIDYVKLKRYNKLNGITSSVSPEELYNIDANDLELLTNLFNLKPKIMYNQNLHYEDKYYMLENHHSNIKPIINTIELFDERPCYEIGQIYNEIHNQGKLKNNFRLKRNKEQSSFLASNNFEGNNKYDYYNERYDIPRNIKNKSYGYENPFENYYYYIDRDISIPQHTNMMFPESTRLENTINRFNDNFYKK